MGTYTNFHPKVYADTRDALLKGKATPQEVLILTGGFGGFQAKFRVHVYFYIDKTPELTKTRMMQTWWRTMTRQNGVRIGNGTDGIAPCHSNTSFICMPLSKSLCMIYSITSPNSTEENSVRLFSNRILLGAGSGPWCTPPIAWPRSLACRSMRHDSMQWKTRWDLRRVVRPDAVGKNLKRTKQYPYIPTE